MERLLKPDGGLSSGETSGISLRCSYLIGFGCSERELVNLVIQFDQTASFAY